MAIAFLLWSLVAAAGASEASQTAKSHSTQTAKSHSTKSCSTKNVIDFTPGVSVTGSTCPAELADGQSCEATCGSNTKVYGTVKCLHGVLHDVSMCLPKADHESMRKFKGTNVVKVFGGWELTFDRAVENTTLITAAVVKGFKVRSDFVESVRCKKLDGTTYHVDYGLICKPGLKGDHMKTFAHNFLQANSTNYKVFTTNLESNGLKLLSIAESHPAVAVDSFVFKNSEGSCVNAHTAFVNSWDV